MTIGAASPAAGAASTPWYQSALFKNGLIGAGAAGLGYGAGAAGGQGGGNDIWGQIFGTPGGIEQAQNFTPEQLSALQQSLQQYQQGGGAGNALNYYQNILNGSPETFQAFEAPALRQFNEQIVPGIAERFSAVGGQRSSAFPQALSQAGAGLSENLAAQRAQLQGQAATGIMQYLNQILGARPFENYYKQGSPGLLGYAAQGLGSAAGAAAFL